MAIIKKKTWPELFEEVASGKKKCDVRLNDFEINEGDTLILEEWDPGAGDYTGRIIEKKVTHVMLFDLNRFNQAEKIKEKGLLVISLDNGK